MGYIALAVGHLLPRVMTKKNVPRYISRSVLAAGCGTRVIVILFWREINPCSWRFLKVPRLLFLAGNCSSTGLDQDFCTEVQVSLMVGGRSITLFVPRYN
jgi:glycerol uptake facilitator-like aquaporin